MRRTFLRTSTVATTAIWFFSSMSCSIPVTKAHWERCEAICQSKGGMKEACVERMKGPGCHCGNEEVIWLDQATR